MSCFGLTQLYICFSYSRPNWYCVVRRGGSSVIRHAGNLHNIYAFVYTNLYLLKSIQKVDLFHFLNCFYFLISLLRATIWHRLRFIISPFLQLRSLLSVQNGFSFHCFFCLFFSPHRSSAVFIKHRPTISQEFFFSPSSVYWPIFYKAWAKPARC